MAKYGFIAQIGGDTSGLKAALKDVDDASRSINSEMRQVNQALKMDPSNVTAVSQKMQLLRQQAEQTKEKLRILREQQEAVAEAVSSGRMDASAYREYQREIAGCEAELRNLNRQQSETVKQAFAGVMKGVAVAAEAAAAALAAVGAAMADISKTGMGFDTAMSQVAATMAITADSANYEKLSNAAKEMGSTTKYSATQAAEALNYLALAGYDADRAVEALPGILNLAQAGAMELATASDMVTDTMSALGLASKDAAENQANMTELTDKMAVTAQKSNTSVAQLGEALLTVGGTAKSLSGGLTETATMLGVIADNGVKGAEGGTALRNIILSLTAPTEKAAGVMADLGLQVSDADGQMRPMVDILADLNGALEGMGDADKTAVLNEIFNKVDLKSVNALLSTTDERFEELSGYINDSAGAAKQMADTMNDNLEGALTSVSSAFEGFQLDLYDKFAEPLKDSANLLAETIRGMTGEVDADTLKATADSLGAEIAEMLKSTAATIGETADELLDPLLSGINENMEAISQAGADILMELVDSMIKSLPYMVDGAFKLVEGLANSIAESLPELLPDAMSAIMDILLAAINNIQPIIEAAKNIVTGLCEGVVKALPEFIEMAPQIIVQFIAAVLAAVPQIISIVPEIFRTLGDAILSIDWLDTGKKMIENLVGAFREGWENVKEQGVELCKDIAGWFGLNLDEMISEEIARQGYTVLGSQEEADKRLEEARKELAAKNKAVEDEKKANAEAILAREKERAEKWKQAQVEAGEAAASGAEEEAEIIASTFEEAQADLENRLKTHKVTEAEYWQERREIADRYRDEESADWWEYYDKITEYYDKQAETEAKAREKEQSEREKAQKKLESDYKKRFDVIYSQLKNEEISRENFNKRYLELVEECAEKQVDISEYAANKIAEYDGKIRKENLSAWEKSSKEISDKITKAYDDVTKAYEKARDEYSKSLNLVREKITDNTGKERYILEDFKKQTKAIKDYQDSLQKLKQTGIGEDLLNQVLSLSYDSGERQGVINEILGMSDKQREKYYADAEEYYSTINDAAKADTADKLTEADKLAKEGIEKIYADMPKESYQKGLETAQSYLVGIMDGMKNADSLRLMGADMGTVRTTSAQGAESGGGNWFSGDMRIVIDVGGKQKEFTLNDIVKNNVLTGGNTLNV